MVVGRLVSFWVPVTFQGRTVNFQECRGFICSPDAPCDWNIYLHGMAEIFGNVGKYSRPMGHGWKNIYHIYMDYTTQFCGDYFNYFTKHYKDPY